MPQGGKLRYSGGVSNVEVKGWRNGLLLILPPETLWENALASLEERLGEANARSFWKGAPAVLDLGARDVSLEKLSALVDRLKEEFGLIPMSVVTSEPTTRQAGEKLVLTVYDELPLIQKAGSPAPAEKPGQSAAASISVESNARYIRRSVRSGQRIEHDGHLVVCGDVNPGSEVMAAGDIVVLGNLRGVAHAGCFGDETARIVALSLRPPQMRIASRIARAPENEKGNKELRPEVARIEDGEIQVFPL